MKHITILSILTGVLLASNSFGLSFVWGSDGAIKFDGSNLKSNDKVTGYLYYLGSGKDLATSYKLTESGIDTTTPIGVEVDDKNKTSAYSKLTDTYTFDVGSKVNGDTFAMLLVYTGSTDGKTYYNLSSDVYSLSGIPEQNPDVATLSAASFSFGDGKSSSTTISGGGGWVAAAIPEPSTAALALAGLALLLKRRKA